MALLDSGILCKFDKTVNGYLVFLVHVQKSSLIPVSNKIPIFNRAEDIANEIYSYVHKIIKYQDQYNIEETKENIKEKIDELGKTIKKEMEHYKNDVKINEDALFLFSDIVQTLDNSENGIKFSRNSIEHLFSYKELSRDKNNEKYIAEQLKNIKEKLDDELYQTKLKTFLRMLYRKNDNAERYYEVNHFILNKCKVEKITLIVPSQNIEIKYGLYFIINKNDITIKRATDNGTIEYTIKFSDFADNFNINIHGDITVNRHETFFINETYPNNMRGEIINTFNLKTIIKLCNELYLQNIQEKPDAPDYNDIDDYLSGKIDNT